MRKKVLKMFVAALAISTLTACGSAPAPAEVSESVETVENTTQEQEKIEETQTEEPLIEEPVEEISARDMYQDIIDDYIAFYKSEKPLSKTVMYPLIGQRDSILNYGTYNNSWLGSYDPDQCFDSEASQYMYANTLNVDAKFIDLNDDGVEEMLIVESDDSYAATGNIHDVWAIVDGQPTYITYFDARFDLLITSYGELKEITSSGWNCNTFATLVFNADGTFTATELVEQIPDGDNSTFMLNGDTPLTSDEFDGFADKYYDYIRMDLTTFDGVNIGTWKK